MNRSEFTIIAKKAVREVMGKSRPNTLFEQAFYDLREKARSLKKKWEEQAKTTLQNQVVSDLKSKGIEVLDAKLSLGNYRGSGFVTSFKLKIKADEATAEKIATYLRGKYSPKWKVKKVSEDGVADLNVR
jgi:hypothetical protein